ncbi:MAG TPA: transcriptional regulator [Bacillota bacterium]
MDLSSLPEAFESRIRVAVLAILSKDQSKSFSDLKAITGAADGNLSVHLRRLEEAGYITIQKRFANLRPQTIYTITERGKNEFREYIDFLGKLIAEDEKS